MKFPTTVITLAVVASFEVIGADAKLRKTKMAPSEISSIDEEEKVVRRFDGKQKQMNGKASYFSYFINVGNTVLASKEGEEFKMNGAKEEENLGDLQETKEAYHWRLELEDELEGEPDNMSSFFGDVDEFELNDETSDFWTRYLQESMSMSMSM